MPTLQDLPLHGARLCLDLERFATRVLGRDFRHLSLVVACSGGVDSTALLLLLSSLAGRNHLHLRAAHLNHGLRSEADEDEAFVADLCADIGVRLFTENADVATQAVELGMGVEEAARKARYAFLEHVRTECGADLICTAHQLNDLAEDQLLRLIRGTGWPGLAGMAAHDPDRHLLRPLLLIPRSDLTTLLLSVNQTWREDASNQDTSLTRNRVRHELLPLFLRDNPAYLKAAARLWDMGRADEEHWADLAADALDHEPDGALSLPLPETRDCSRAERLRLYKAALDLLGPGQALAENLFQLDRLVMDKKTGSVVQFPGDKQAKPDPERIRFSLFTRG